MAEIQGLFHNVEEIESENPICWPRQIADGQTELDKLVQSS